MEQSGFRDVVAGFVEELKRGGKSEYTLVAYKKDLEQFIDHLTEKGKTTLPQVERADIETFVQTLIETKGYTKKSASRKLNSIRTFFRYLKNANLVLQNPASDIAHPKYEQAPPRILSRLEYRGLRDVAKDDPRTYAMVELLLQTGMKIGELSELTLEDVKPSSISVRSGRKVSRSVPLNKAASNALKEYLKVRPPFPDTHIFITRTGRPMRIRNIRQIINRCFIDVGIQGATVNDLRNTFIAHQLTSGAGLEYIAQIVGHRRLSSTERFLNLVKHETERKEKLGEL